MVITVNNIRSALQQLADDADRNIPANCTDTPLVSRAIAVANQEKRLPALFDDLPEESKERLADILTRVLYT